VNLRQVAGGEGGLGIGDREGPDTFRRRSPCSVNAERVLRSPPMPADDPSRRGRRRHPPGCHSDHRHHP